MSDLSARTSSALAITEKKPHIQRAGGCVGIFFQLFDWNRRFAKNKFFPKKLLPPGNFLIFIFFIFLWGIIWGWFTDFDGV